MNHNNLQIGYQQPPQEMMDLVDPPLTPSISIDPSGKWLILFGRQSLPSIAEVAQPEVRLAGLRINPRTNDTSRSTHYTSFDIKNIATGEVLPFLGLPNNPKIKNLAWSPNGQAIAFTLTTDKGLALWVAQLSDRQCEQLSDAIINDAMPGLPYCWLSDNETLIYKSIVTDRGTVPTDSYIPKGPVIQENKGKTAAVRTYQDLLKNQQDEALFQYYTTAQLIKVSCTTKVQQPIGKAGIISFFSPSPNGQFLLIQVTTPPFSYTVPYSRFASKAMIWNTNGQVITTLTERPVLDAIPKGFGAVAIGQRGFTWRLDVPSTIFWVEAQDGGDPKNDVPIRDQLFYLNAPFDGEAQKSISFKLRYGGVTWGTGDIAISREWWWQNRRDITKVFSPDMPSKAPTVLFDRSWEDKYNAPGNFVTQPNQWGRRVLWIHGEGEKLFLLGQGASPEGNRPFLDEFYLPTQTAQRLWRSEAPHFEMIIRILDADTLTLITRRESIDTPPNYFMRSLKNNTLTAFTDFPNPFKALEGVQKELIRYERADGVKLVGTLYLPKGYDVAKDGTLPVLMWAYPREYKSIDAAGQVKNSPHEFIRVGPHSPILWVTQGYAIFDSFSMPIIGEGDEEPNETFIKQLVAGAEAAIDTLVDKGIADRKRIALGGHSYGAFMTANLLAHSNLFAAGIARSGAFNRTLTPFGFQSEERTLWETPETYIKMSPFMNADKINAPLLLIHGEADNNSGTYPMQSERFYSALKGHGATTRLVMLPHESHGYRAKDSLFHMVWEMNEWLKLYC